MIEMTVSCSPDASGWACVVHLRDPDGSSTRHRVSVSAGDLFSLDAGAPDPTELVRRSFAFLLEREPKESILRSFELGVIGRYFPDYEAQIRSKT